MAAFSVMGQPHAVIIPFPGPGHINPQLDLAKLLHYNGFYITFVDTEFSHQCILRSRVADSLGGLDYFRFETISDGFSQSAHESPDYGAKLALATRENCETPFRQLLVKLNSSPGVPPVTCIIPNGLMSFALNVASELGIPALVFWTMSACGFMGYLHISELIRRGYTPLKDESYLTNGYLDTHIDWIPGMKDICLKDLPSFIRATDPDDILLNFDQEEANNSFKAWGLILNTFDNMEGEVLNAMKCMFPRIYTVGPLLMMLNQIANDHLKAMRLSVWKEDSGCMEWLNTQREASVVYVNFGSLTILTAEQLLELAWGLADSKHPFLWIIRSNLVLDKHVVLPEDFIMETKGRSFVASWCSQEEVLSHPSVGGFLTHSGWNSTLESVCAGVPMICWPNFADQYMNCRYACKEWGIGVELDQEVKREQVKKLVRELMEGKKGVEMRKNAMKWKEAAKQATEKGGSSYEDIKQLIRDLDPAIMGKISDACNQ